MAAKSERLCVVIPVYNEQDIVRSVLEGWCRALNVIGIDYVVRAYDDGSSDRSLAEMQAARLLNPRIEVRSKKNGGHGGTILVGYREAVADGFDWIFQVDSDNEMSSDRFNELWARRNDHDFLVGRREGRIQSIMRLIMSFVSRLCVRVLYGSGVWDVNSPYRLMRVSAFREYIEELPLTTFAPNVILSGAAARDGLRLLEVPVPQHDRMTGEVSIKKGKLFKAALLSFWQTFVFAAKGWLRPGKIIAASLVSIVMGLFCLGTNPFAKSMRCIDEMVFLYVGESMRRGLMPYRDVFDHKGPLLYVINWIGLSVSGGETWGVWLIEGLLLVIGCLLLMRWGARVIGSPWGRLAILPYLILVFCSICGGNICETYALFFVAVALACDLKPAPTGLCMAALFMVKYTLAVPLGVAFLALNFRISHLIRCGCWCILGVLPLIWWMWAQGVLQDFSDVYIGFNLAYSRYRVVPQKHLLFIARATVPAVLCLIVYICMILRMARERGWMAFGRDFRCRAWAASFIYTIVGLALTLAIRAHEDYYYIPLLPGCFIAMALLMERVANRSKSVIRTICACGFLVMAFLIFRTMVYVTPYARAVVRGAPVFEVLKNIRKTDYREILVFKERIADKESVTVLGNLCALYRVLEARTPWKYPYQMPISRVSAPIRNAVEHEIVQKSSRYLIFPKWEDGATRLFEGVVKMNYNCISETEDFMLWEANGECTK